MKTLTVLCLLFLGTGKPTVVKVSSREACKTIAEAVRLARPYDSVVVMEGVYREKGIIIDKPVTITGSGKVIVQLISGKDLMIIKADDVQITGLHCMNVARSFISDNAAIKVESARNCRIMNNFFTNNFFAIYLSRTSGGIIRNNTISSTGLRESSSGNGIHLWNCRDIVISHNTIVGHRDGIYLEFSRALTISNNVSEKNLRYGLHFMFSDSCWYYKNEFRNNGAGVAVMYSRVITMKYNTFLNNQGTSSYGLLLKDIKDSEVSGNIFTENTTGIFMEAALRILFFNNTIKNCGWAVKLMANSMENTFRNNNFLGNTFDITSNSRHDDNRFLKNYWDNYSGYDFNRDGIGDVPYYPVSLFSVIVAENPPLLILLKSFFISVLDVAERMAPVLTPANLVDMQPLMRRHP